MALAAKPTKERKLESLNEIVDVHGCEQDSEKVIRANDRLMERSAVLWSQYSKLLSSSYISYTDRTLRWEVNTIMGNPENNGTGQANEGRIPSNLGFRHAWTVMCRLG